MTYGLKITNPGGNLILADSGFGYRYAGQPTLVSAGQKFFTTLQPYVYEITIPGLGASDRLIWGCGVSKNSIVDVISWYHVSGNTFRVEVNSVNFPTETQPDWYRIYEDMVVVPPQVYCFAPVTSSGGEAAGQKIAVFGDSVSTYGGLELIPGADPSLESSYNQNLTNRIDSVIQKLYPSANVVLVARGGMTTSEALGITPSQGSNPFGSSGTITQWITDNAPNKIVLRYGLADAVITNNSTTTLNNLQTIIDYAVARGIEVILIGVNPAAPVTDPANCGYTTNTISASSANTAITINSGIISKATAQGFKYANPRTLTAPTCSLPDGIHPFYSFGTTISNEIYNQLFSQIPASYGLRIFNSSGRITFDSNQKQFVLDSAVYLPGYNYLYNGVNRLNPGWQAPYSTFGNEYYYGQMADYDTGVTNPIVLMSGSGFDTVIKDQSGEPVWTCNWGWGLDPRPSVSGKLGRRPYYIEYYTYRTFDGFDSVSGHITNQFGVIVNGALL